MRTNPKLVEISKKAITLSLWRWMPGMQGLRNCEPSFADYLRPEVRICNYKDIDVVLDLLSIPDLADPATIGAILQLVKDGCKDPQAYLCYFAGYDGVEWAVCSDVIELIREELGIKPYGWMRNLAGTGSTEGEALIHALEQAEEVYAAFKNYRQDGSGN